MADRPGGKLKIAQPGSVLEIWPNPESFNSLCSDTEKACRLPNSEDAKFTGLHLERKGDL
jgi:hypothetical protein